MEEMFRDQLQRIQAAIELPFWRHVEFWIGAAGLAFSFLAFFEARQAKRAAREAGKIVKMQTVVSDLTEISMRLDRLNPEIEFTEARDFLNEVSRRIRRLVSPFSNDGDLSGAIANIRESLTQATHSLNDVLPEPGVEEPLAARATYYAVQASLATVNGFIADLLGLLESKSSHISEDKERRWFRRAIRLTPKVQDNQDSPT